jgi:predicted nucleic acid-binding protein
VSVALDTNILLYAVNADDPRQQTARDVLSGLVGGTIITHDRDFRRFDGIRVRDPFA